MLVFAVAAGLSPRCEEPVGNCAVDIPEAIIVGQEPQSSFEWKYRALSRGSHAAKHSQPNSEQQLPSLLL
jgi:hypothetical protein